MADKIRGITIQIGGDTSGLTKSLKQSNTEIKSTQSQLRDVEKLLKLDPTNIDLLKQKEQLLNQEVAQTSAKLDELKQLQATMDANGVDKNSEQYMALQREIISTQNAFENAQSAASNYNTKLEQVAARSQQVADKAGEIAEKTWGITAAVAAMGVGAVTTTADFDEKMSQLAATMGVSTDEIGELREFAKQMGSETAFSASEAAEGLNILAMSGLNAEQQMAVLPSVLNLAAAGGIDMATAASYVVGSINGFGDSADNATYYADLMAKGATLAATDVNGLGEALSGTAATAAGYGQSADEVAEAALRLANQNVTGSEAVTGLNRVMSDLYSPTSAAAKQLRKLGVSAYDAEGNARPLNDVIDDINAATADMSDKKRANVLGNIFSDKGLQTFNKMAATTGEDLDKLTSGLEEAGGSASEQAATMLDNLNGKLTLLKSAVEGAAISIGEKMMPYIDKLVEIVQKAVEWFNGLSEEQLNTILVIAGIVAAIAPLAKAISGISKGVSWISKTGLPGLKKAFNFLKANPFLVVVTAVVTLVTLIGKNADKIREYLQKIDDFLQNVFATDFTQIFGDGVLGKALNSFMAGVKVVWDNFKSAFEWVISFCEKIVNGDWAGVWEDLKGLFQPAIDWITEKWQGLCDFVTNLLNGDFTAAFGEDSTFGQALTNFSNFVSGVWEGIKGFFTGAYEKISGLFETDFTEIFGEDSFIGKALNTLRDLFSTRIELIKGFFSGAYETISALLEGDFAGAFGEDSPIGRAFTSFKQFFSDTWDSITGFFDGAFDTISKLLDGDFSGIFGEGSAVRTAFDGCSGFFSDTWDDITGFFDGAYKKVKGLFETDFTTIFGEGSVAGTALNTLRDLFKGRIETITGFFDGMVETVSSLLDGDFAGAFGEDSPIGQAIESFKGSIDEKVSAIGGFFSTCVSTTKSLMEGDFASVFGEDSKVAKALGTIRSKVGSIFGEEGIMGDIQGILDWLKTTFTSGWEEAWETISGAVSGVWNGVVGAVKKPINSIIDVVNKMIGKINNFIDDINSISVLGMSTSIGHIGTIGKLAKGGVVPMGGTALVGENGAELLTVANGHATVTPLGGGRSGNTINVYTQEMTEAQVDYLIARVNRGLAYA